jgi:hypothetical protein
LYILDNIRMNTVSPIDKFRQDFFEKVIQQEKEQAAALKRKQLNCWHKYEVHGHTLSSSGTALLVCSKCGHSSTRRF